MGVLGIPKTKEEWEYKFLPHLTDGVTQAEKPEDIKETQTTTAINVRYEKNRVLLDSGFVKFGQALIGNVRAVFQFWKKTGDAYLTAITDDTFYVWNEGLDEWQLVSDGTTTTLSSGVSAGATSIQVDSISGFSSGDIIGVTLSDNTELQTTINGAPSGSTINLTDPLPGAASGGGLILKAPKFNGITGLPVSIEVFTPADLMIFVNGVDTPKKFDGTSVSDLGGLPTTPFTARVVTTFNDHLVFLYTLESGTAYPQRLRRSDTADPENWTTGNAGYTDLFGSEDWLVAVEHLGPYMILYKERSIIRVEYVGLAEELFSFTTVITGEGARSRDSIVNLGDEHIFFGRANIYRYRGGYTIDPIGDPVYHKIFSVQGHLNPSEDACVHGIYVEEADEVWFIYPHEDYDLPRRMIRVTPSNNYALSEREFTTGISGYGFYVLLYSRDWSLLEGDWGDQTWEWGARVTLSNAPTTHLCLENQVMEYNYLEHTDDGTEIDYVVDTSDFYLPNVFARFDRLSVSARGTGIQVFYSTDEGQSWIFLQEINPGVAFTRVRIWKQFIGRTVRFRFMGTGGNFGLEWLAFEYCLESEW